MEVNSFYSPKYSFKNVIRTRIMRLNRTWVWYSSCFQFKNVLKIKNALKEWELKMVMHLWITKILVLVLLLASSPFYIKSHPFRVTDPEILILNLWKAYGRLWTVKVRWCSHLLTAWSWVRFLISWRLTPHLKEKPLHNIYPTGLLGELPRCQSSHVVQGTEQMTVSGLLNGFKRP